MTHHHLRLHSSCSFKRNGNNDKYRGTAHCYIHLGHNSEDDREYSDNAEEHSSDERDLSEDLLQMIGGRLSGSYTGDSAVVLSQIVGDLNRVVLHGNIEIVESNDEYKVQASVER